MSTRRVRAAARSAVTLVLSWLTMTSHSFPDPVFESLLEKLAQTLEVAQRADSTLDPQTRQALYQTVTFT